MDENVECLLCEEDVDVGSLSLHIQKHLKYCPMRCKTCDEVFFTEDYLNAHLAAHSHQSRPAKKNLYMEHLMVMIRLDMVHAKLHGIESMLKLKPKRDYDNAVSAGGDTSSSKEKAQSKEALQLPAERVVQCIETAGRKRMRTTEKEPPVKKRLLREESPPSIVSLPNSSTSTLSAQTIKEVLTSDASEKCALCKKNIQPDYKSRREHCSKFHMGHTHTEDDYLLLLETEMQRAFPGLVYSDYQCTECMVEVKSKPARLYHVARYHSNESLHCPIEGCNHSWRSTKEVNDHLRKQHNLVNGRSSLRGETATAFNFARSQFNSLLELRTAIFFPVPLPAVPESRPPAKTPLSSITETFKAAVIPSQKVPIRTIEPSDSSACSSSEDDEDEVAVKTKKTQKAAALPEKKQTRKESSSESDEEEGEDKEIKETEVERQGKSVVPVQQKPVDTAGVASSLSNGSATSSPSAVKQEVVTPSKEPEPYAPISQTNPPTHFIARVIPPARTPRNFPCVDESARSSEQRGRCSGLQKQKLPGRGGGGGPPRGGFRGGRGHAFAPRGGAPPSRWN